MSHFFASGAPNIGVSTLASASPMNIQDWYPLGWNDWISLQSKGLSRVFPTPQFKNISSWILSFLVQLSHPYLATEKIIALTRQMFVSKVMSLLFIMLSRLAIGFLPSSKRLWFHGCNHHLQRFWSPSKLSLSVPIVSPSICHEVMGPDAMIWIFWMLSFKPVFFTLFFHFHQAAL